MLCMAPEDTQLVKWYFVSFCFGIIFFCFPDYLGRKATMDLMLIPVVVGNSMLVFSDNLVYKCIGYSIFGLFHIRQTLSYTICIELLPESFKTNGSTFINFVDISSMVWSCVYLVYRENKIQALYETLFAIYFTASLVYLMIVPETPRWLFM